MKIIEGFEAARKALSRRAGAPYAVSGALKKSLKKLFKTEDPEEAVRKIIDEVRKDGDAALRRLTSHIDGIKLGKLEADRDEITAAYAQVDEELVAAITMAGERVFNFHLGQKNSIHQEVNQPGLWQQIRPLQRVGVYVPGGTAVYPSAVLMTAIPAKAAGVEEVVMVTPPQANGSISPATLVAADIARVDRIFRVGGAQAVAALAYGTKSVPPVDKICGPGNIFVTLAKKQVFGVVDIDGLQGPSEVMLIADGTASAEYCAADLLAQAEHDLLAEVIMVTTSWQLADDTLRQLNAQLANLPRRPIAEGSLERGIIAVVGSIDEAIELADLYAPEHLCLMMENAASYVDQIYNAGCIVAGRGATVALGDYVAGPSHALPTGGTARFGSPLNVLDFIKLTSVISTDELDIKEIGRAASIIARAEGLDAHAQAVEKRLRDVK